MKNTTNKKDTRVDATFIIWGCATGMMAICIPLVSVSKSGFILPLAVILGASVSTVSVWRSDKQKSLKYSHNLQQIEQRVRDLETICSSDNIITNKFEQLKK